MSLEHVKRQDPELYAAITREMDRQKSNIELIASENFTSVAVMEATGSQLTNKYAEGYPHKRYYGGCEYVDEAEVLAIERLKELFGAEHANVQPHSGSQANMGVYMAVLEPGDKILGMNLNEDSMTKQDQISLEQRLLKIESHLLSIDRTYRRNRKMVKGILIATGIISISILAAWIIWMIIN